MIDRTIFTIDEMINHLTILKQNFKEDADEIKILIEKMDYYPDEKVIRMFDLGARYRHIETLQNLINRNRELEEAYKNLNHGYGYDETY